jgi:hypothetical protein
MQVGQIIEGHVNELLGKNKELHDVRLEICKECPLYRMTFVKDWFGAICDPNKYINSEGRISFMALPGYKKGCACRLEAKTRVPEAHCIIDKW